MDTDQHGSALEKMADRIDKLPVLSHVITRLLALNPNVEDYFDQVLALVQQDPPFAARLIQLANSATSAPVSEIDTLRAAATRLGVNQVRGLVLGLSVARVFVPSDPDQQRLWTHSVQTAVGAAELARQTTSEKIDPEVAYLAGLLHDIGRFVMLEFAPDELREVDDRDWESPEALVDADLAVFRYTHSELGGLACEHWGLPAQITAIARHHHQTSADALPTEVSEFSALLDCVRIADRLSVCVMCDPSIGELPREEVVHRISTDCLNQESSRLTSPEALAASVSDLVAESERILEGLKFD